MTIIVLGEGLAQLKLENCVQILYIESGLQSLSCTQLVNLCLMSHIVDFRNSDTCTNISFSNMQISIMHVSYTKHCI